MRSNCSAAVVEQLSQYFGSCLVVEIWANPTDKPIRRKLRTATGIASFRRYEVLTPATRIPRAAIEALSKSLGRDVLPYGGTRIVILTDFENLAPLGSRPLIRPRDCRDWNCFPLGNRCPARLSQFAKAKWFRMRSAS